MNKDEFLKRVKTIYEERTGEAMLPMEEWSDMIRKWFDYYHHVNDAEGFVSFVIFG